MGLDIVMLGESSLKSLKEDPSSDSELSMLVGYLVANFPEAKSLDFKEPLPDVTEGHRVGTYSDLHFLRGLAVLVEQDSDMSATTQEELEAAAEAFYKREDQSTRFEHLLQHADDSGYYVPFEFPKGMWVEGTIEEDEVQISIGSSQALLRELDALGPVIGLAGDLGDLGEEELIEQAEQHRWPIAAYVWGVLRYYARESVNRTGIVLFC
jgi:hypothetical protein